MRKKKITERALETVNREAMELTKALIEARRTETELRAEIERMKGEKREDRAAAAEGTAEG